jgi:long-chain acyl-CoA synthetase
MVEEPRTLAEIFEQTVERRPRPDAYLRKSGGAWVPVASADVAVDARRAAGALAALGLKPGDRVGILSYNRLEWVLADWACQIAGFVDVPVYATLPADQVQHILRDAGARAVFVENAAQAAKIGGAVPRVIAFEPAPGATLFADFLRGAPPPPAHRPSEEDLATLLYTSGTTGVPKGVMLTHRNLVSNILACCAVVPCTADDLVLSFLPLSHSFERIMDYALFWKGASIAHAEHVDRIAENLLEVRPTVMAAVPRFFEKVHAKVRQGVAAQKPLKRALFEWARGVGAIVSALRRSGAPVPFRARFMESIARALVLKRLAARVGGRIRTFISGGGALSRDVAEFFHSVGLPILEGYGLTESSPVICLQRHDRLTIGTVGPPVPGVEIRLAEDGEILARGPNIMKGYWKLPEETAQTVRDGWLYTGDIGEIDASGALRITDRKKDLLKTSGGKFVAPQPIENALKLRPGILNAVVVGDRRKFAAALVVPAPGSGEAEVRAAVDGVNRSLAPHEQLKKFALLAQDFTIESGELTPTMKVRRREVERKHAALIESLYSE